MSNINNIIAGHNRKLLNTNTVTPMDRTCNCRGGISACPVQGTCLSQSVIYKAEIIEIDNKTKSKGPPYTYIGLASNSFKERYSNHIDSFDKKARKDSTALSKFVWKTKDRGNDFSIHWQIIKSAPSYHPNIQTCHLCNMEKPIILTSTYPNLLNQRKELLSKCRHRKKHLLENLV